MTLSLNATLYFVYMVGIPIFLPYKITHIAQLLFAYA